MTQTDTEGEVMDLAEFLKLMRISEPHAPEVGDWRTTPPLQGWGASLVVSLTRAGVRPSSR
jgi:hypothetical protein